MKQLMISQFLIQIYTNIKTSRLCIRHKIPALINEKYMPEIEMNKIETHSDKGFTVYAKNHIINNYEYICNIRHCYVCNAHQWFNMLGLLFLQVFLVALSSEVIICNNNVN